MMPSTMYELLLKRDGITNMYLNDIRKAINGIYEQVSPAFNATENYEVMFKYLFSTTVDCDKFIKKCLWNTREIDCGKYFMLVPSDAGYCCSFNFERDMLKEDIPMAVAKLSEEADGKTAEGFHFFDFPLSSTPLVPTPGNKLGLTVILDSSPHETNYTSLYSDQEGFRAAVSSQSDASGISTKGFLVTPGHVTEVAISAEHYSTDPALNTKMTPEQRGCFFPHEYELKVFRK